MDWGQAWRGGVRGVFLLAALLMWSSRAGAQSNAEVLEVENIVQASKGKQAWGSAKAGQKLAVRDRIRTRQRSRAMVKVSDLYTMRMDQFTTVEISPRITGSEKPTLDVVRGITFIFSRAREGEIDIKTPAANAALRGTQLMVEVGENGKTMISVLEGRVDLSNAQGQLLLEAGESGEVEVGKAPQRTAKIEARNLVQWALYYPGVLEVDALGLAGNKALARSVAAYRQGDLMNALEHLPAGVPGGDGARVYHAQVLLAVGRVDEARRLLATVGDGNLHKQALRRLIAAVMLEPQEEMDLGMAVDLVAAEAAIAGRSDGSLALAESYYLQASHQLVAARLEARRAVELNPNHGFAWVRLAELEFSFGDNRAAEAALVKGLQLTPRNAQAHALQGFILAGRNSHEAAAVSFQRALDIDGALGNGWLGRGLVKIRRGDLEGGRADLQAAATVEPTRALFHSYLGKAFGEEGRDVLAAKDFDLAKRMDSMDPTPWLYSAIEHQRNNQPNKAIDDLTRSVELNDNRRVFRSQMLLDQDRAVRSANLAKMYQNAGMMDVAVREATRAVEADYTSASAHLFLANSFDALRDPRRVALRYETPWFNELLLANMFAPVGGGPLSQFVSQQEYSKLFQQDGLGASFSNEWRSDDELYSTASVFGTQGNFEFGLDVNYREAEGSRANADSDLLEVYLQAKWQATPDDMVYFLGKWQEQSSGDNFQTFDNKPLAPFVDFEERQSPGLLLGGWNHRWKPGVHTLFLGGKLSAEQRLSDPMSNQLLVQRDPSGLQPGFLQPTGGGGLEFTDPVLRAEMPRPGSVGPDGETLVVSPILSSAIQPYLGSGDVLGVGSAPFDFSTVRKFDLYTAELQQVFQTDRHTILLGARVQSGDIESSATLLAERPNFYGGFPTPAAEQDNSYRFDRYSLYAYDYWKVRPDLTLIGGVTWDRVHHPDNFRNPPLGEGSGTDERLSGKLGFTYAPSKRLTVRGAFSEGLGGVTFDESVRLEPVQIAGINQSYRTVISESLAGSVEAPEFTTWGLSFEGVLPTRTWWGVAFGGISQDVTRDIGVFTGYDVPGVFDFGPAFFPDSLRQELSYEEQSLAITLNQLVGDQFAVGSRYKVTRSELEQRVPDLVGFLPEADLTDEAWLHELSVFADWNSPMGLYSRVEATWYHQKLNDDDARPSRGGGDDFTQVNAKLGYRFSDNQGEISAGILNLLDTDYELSPLSPYVELPRERTFVLRCRWNF